MGETNERYDLGEKRLKPGQSVWLNGERFDMPEGEYLLYAERRVEEPLAGRMADFWGGWWTIQPTSDASTSSDEMERRRMQSLIDEFGLVERSKLPDPVEVPDWVQRWLDGDVPIAASRSNLKAWIRDALVAGAVRVEKPEVPDDVVAAASDLTSMYGGTGLVGDVGTLINWVLEQAGETNG
ncbi:MAG: hypothetical protein GY708_09705 [Actinomycetia bacterium]|nr:hypothetical protein [Actinomycetes bacterium]